MQKPADLEDHTPNYPVTPCEIIPARELLGDLFLAMNKPKESLRAYTINLENHPNRFNGIYGAAMASVMNDDRKTAKMYFEKLILLSASVESKRSALQYATEFLSTY